MPSTLPSARLPIPEAVDRRRIHWRYALPIGVIHVLALAAFIPGFFSWAGVVIMIVGVHVFGQGITLCYHRQLAHRSFSTPRWLERCFVILALCCLEDAPARWVATHRYHHAHSDEPVDPHSPLVTFFWSHVGWLLLKNRKTHRIELYGRFARDLLDDPFYMKLEKSPWLAPMIYAVHALVFVAAGAAVGWSTSHDNAEAVRMAASFFIWGVVLRTVVVWHITWSVNSLTHMFGYRNFETKEHSRNNWFVALITVGEGWHNNHHHDPSAANAGRRWWELDITYLEIRLLQCLGLARDVTPVREQRADIQGHA